jgi:hypothetical protein
MERLPKNFMRKFISKLKEERSEIFDKLAEVDFQLSNLEAYIDLSLQIASNFSLLWGSDDFWSEIRTSKYLLSRGNFL